MNTGETATHNAQASTLSMACTQALQQLDTFDAIIDVRSPAEFTQDHMPGAINAPVLSNEERALIGTLHKQEGAFMAKRRGAVLVARNIAQHIDEQFQDKPRSWRPLVYCWRGGQRSGAMAHILKKIGWHACQLDGGYRAYRRQVRIDLDRLPEQHRWRVILGSTGSGKSRLLEQLRAAGGQVLNLEAIACHRGSVLGGLPHAEQPTQKWFDSQLWDALRQLDPKRPVFVESESRKVGAVHLPDGLLAAIRQAPCLHLELPLHERVSLLRADYTHYETAPDALITQLRCLRELHGHERIEQWISLAQTGQWERLVEKLLTEHYDPAYARSVGQNFPQAAQAKVLRIERSTDTAFKALAEELLSEAAL